MFARDGGVCAGCGLDAHRLHYGYGPFAEPETIRNARTDTGGIILYRDIAPNRLPGRLLREVLIGLGMSTRYGASLWEADHIRPVAEGGGGCGLENLRTLCWVCHKVETRKLARRLALRRKQQAAEDAGQTDMWGFDEADEA